MWSFWAEYYIGFVLFIAAALLQIFALADAVVRPAQAFPAAGKLTKPAWVVILVLAVLLTLLFRSVLSIFGLIAVIAAGVYLADVRPALREITRR